MTALQAIALMLTFCALGGWVNQKMRQWPPMLAMTIISIVLSCGILVLGKMNIVSVEAASKVIAMFDVENLLLHGILSLLLFAGALFVDVDKLRRWAWSILSLATLGLMMSAAVTAGLVWAVCQGLHVPLPWVWCALFGAMIAPTDPIAALAMLRTTQAPSKIQTKLVGESLFNDGTGVMLFVIILGWINSGQVSTPELMWEILVAPLGAAVLGLVAGALAIRAIATLDHHPTEMMITLALATGVYGLAEHWHLSAPIATVVAGLMIGHRARHVHMSDQTRSHLDASWQTIDEVLNALLFALIGLEMLVINLTPIALLMGALAWMAVLVGRWVGVYAALPQKNAYGSYGMKPLLVWGGLRGGISLALALSLPPSPQASLLVTTTFVVVVLSSVVQGLSLPKVVNWLASHGKWDKGDLSDDPPQDVTVS